jgi:hypothetical protein
MDRDRASSSLLALVVVMALCLLCAAAGLCVGFVSRQRESAEARGKARAEADNAFASWLSLYGKNAGADDSPFDAYAGDVSFADASCLASDLSSRINPNWVDPALFEKTSLGALLKNGVSPSELRQYRADKGFSSDVAVFYSRFFVEGAFEDALGAYSYADLNTSDEFALEDLYLEMTGDKSSSGAFHARVRDRRLAVRPVSVDDLNGFLAPCMDTVFPAISVSPPMNVNFVSGKTLGALLSYPAFGIGDWSERRDAVLAARARRELSMESLYALLGVAKENPVYRYLGTKTWFWRVSIKNGASTLDAVAARIPPRPGHELGAEKAPEIRVVSREFKP